MSNNNEQDEDSTKRIRIVAGIDFGTTFSGFAYAYKSKPDKVFVISDWPGWSGRLKTPTVLRYDESFKVQSWGYSALAESPERENRRSIRNRKKNQSDKIAERFKLHLSRMEQKPYLPKGLDYKTAITDYLKKLCEVMKDTLSMRVPDIDFFEQVLIVMTIPAEFDNRAMDIMRECAVKAGLINNKNSLRLKFTTEPEAAAVNCMDILKVLEVGIDESFMIVDCGGGTVDLTTRKLLEDNKLGEITKRRGGYCGGSFVDDEFIKFLGRKVGQTAVEKFRENHYCQLQYMIQEFCRRVKFPFTGQKKDFKPFELDLQEYSNLKQYVKDSELTKMEEDEWAIDLKFEDVKEMFNPVIKEIIDLIDAHLAASDASNNVSAMLLVGGFSESKYLQERVKEKFNQRLRNKISVPDQPVTAIVEGAVRFGLRQEVIASRVLKWTYGTDVVRNWEPKDPLEQKVSDDMVVEFSRLAECGDEIPVNAAIRRIFSPVSIFQSKMGLDLYITDKHDAEFCHSEGVKLLGKWSIDVPITFGPRPILFLMVFGEVEINAAAVNLETGDKCKMTFKVDEGF